MGIELQANRHVDTELGPVRRGRIVGYCRITPHQPAKRLLEIGGASNEGVGSLVMRSR